MKKSKKLDREKVTPIQEKDLPLAKGAQHVDNPGQTAMNDGNG
jgi:hypothetical protein